MLHWIVMFVHMTWADPAPFWRAKEKAYERIKNREVLVSVTATENAPGVLSKFKNHLKIAGGGRVRAPAPFVFERTMQYERMMKVSSFVRSAKYDPAAKILDFEIGAFGYTGKFKIRMDTVNNGEERRIFYRVLGGAMDGLNGSFDFRDVEHGMSEVGIDGEFQYDKFPMARIFLEFGMEVVFQRMALQMRSEVERQYQELTGGKK